MANWSGTYTIAAGTTGTLTGATSVTATNSGATWPTGANGLTNMQIRLLTGPGSPATVPITANTATQITVASWPSGTPNNTTTYEIVVLLQNNDHFTATSSFGTTTICEVADNATVLVDGLYIITFTGACTVRFNKTETTMATFAGNNRTVTGKEGFWGYFTFAALLSVKPKFSFLKIQDATYSVVVIPSTTIGDGTTIHHLWGENILTGMGYMTGAASPAGGMILSNLYARNSKSGNVFSATTSSNPQVYDQCWADVAGDGASAPITFTAGGSTLQWCRNFVFGGMGSLDVNANSGVEHRFSECYVSPSATGSCAFGNASAADAGKHSFFMNVAHQGQTIYGVNVTGAGSMALSSNDMAGVARFNALPAINILGALSYTSATSDFDYISGTKSAIQENVDTTMSTSSTANPQQYLNLTAARTNARSVPNFPFTTNNIVVGTPASSSVTITYDCANGALAGQGTTVNVDSASGQKVLSVAATSMFVVGMSIEIGYGTARSETGRIASISAGVSITMENNLTFTHTAAQADAVNMALRYYGLPFIRYGTTPGVYTMQSEIPDQSDWGLLWTGLKTTVNGLAFSWKRTGHSVTLSGLKPNTTYYYSCCAYSPLGDLIDGAGSTGNFTTAAIAGAGASSATFLS